MKAIHFQRFSLAVIIFLAANLTQAVHAQQQTPNPDKWDVRIGLPLWAPGIHGTVGVDGKEAHINDDFWDLLDTLDFLMAANLEVRKSRWLFFTDGIYVKTSTDGAPRGLFSGAEVNVDMKTFFNDVALGYALVKTECFSVEAFAGAQVSFLEPNLSLRLPNLPRADRSASTSKFWADPIVGAYIHYPFSSCVGLYTKGDAGGFGVNSDLTWQIEGGLDFSIGRMGYVRLAYRYLSVDYEKSNLVFDAHVSGPQLELGLRF